MLFEIIAVLHEDTSRLYMFAFFCQRLEVTLRHLQRNAAASRNLCCKCHDEEAVYTCLQLAGVIEALVQSTEQHSASLCGEA
jgi:hypothetical protein